MGASRVFSVLVLSAAFFGVRIQSAHAIALPDVGSSCNSTGNDGCFKITNTAGGTTAVKAILGSVSSTNGSGVFGYGGSSSTAAGVTGQAPFGYGVFGSSSSGYAIYGDSQTGRGVYGATGSFSAGIAAVVGQNSAGGSGAGDGVRGIVDAASSGNAIFGEAGASSLAWAGNFHGDVNVSGGYYVNGGFVASDARLKTDIKAIPYGLAQILAVRPVSYRMKDKADEVRLGVIAQEIQKVLPEIVRTNRATGMLAVDYTAIIPVAVKAIQQQEDTIQQQARVIQQLDARIAALEQSKKPLAASLGTGTLGAAGLAFGLLPIGWIAARRRRRVS